MPEQALPELPPRLERLRSRPTAKAGDWYRIEAKADTRKAEVSIYDEIGWGTNAKDFAGQLRALDADEITLRLNSPGGDAWDGIAIYNALRDHKASVHVVVDGLAASAASFIAQAGDRITMNRGAQMMIHDAAGLAMGNARDMRDMAEVLDRVSDSIAGIYAARSGRPAAEFRAAMGRDTWYTAAEAVDAGLADEVAADPEQPATNSARTRVTAAEAARRIHAAAQKTTTAIQAGDASQKGAGHVDPAKIREALGLPADASDDAVRSALESAGVVNSTTPQPAPAPAPEPTPTPAPSGPAPSPSTPRPTAGTMVIDAGAWEAQQATIARLEANDARRRRDERDQVIAQAVQDGKFPPARKDHWARLWDADPEGTRQVIDGLARNVIPTAALGYAGDGADVDFEMEFAGLFPPSGKGR